MQLGLLMVEAYITIRFPEFPPKWQWQSFWLMLAQYRWPLPNRRLPWLETKSFDPWIGAVRAILEAFQSSLKEPERQMVVVGAKLLAP